jgi:acetyl esterase/lipase
MYFRLFIGLVLGFCASSLATAQGRDIAYGSHHLQSMDVYVPSNPSGAIVMLHGGAWRAGDKGGRGVWRDKAAHWLPQGYVFVSVNTRLIPDAGPIDQARDLAAAMASVQRIVAQHDIEANQVLLMGHSAGAHVASLLAVRQDLQRQAGVQPWQGTILLDTAALDVPAIMRNGPARRFQQAFGSDPTYWAASSPDNYLDRRDGPFLIVCSSIQRNSCHAAQDFGEKASAARVATTILPVRLRHSEINRTLGQSNDYTQSVDNWIETLN